MYLAGSFFQFSAGGWSFLKGYKIWESEDGAKDEGGLLDKLPGFGNKDKDGDANKENGLYVVSSVRASLSCILTDEAQALEQKQRGAATELLASEGVACYDATWSMML